ncbi:MAG: hypothetical protein HC815_05860 [Richelia sp. RM1_1_1]|nr:hypothetical protein [Richelia sp. RM1_1_1]
MSAQIKSLIDGLNEIPNHWLIVPTKMKMPLGIGWNKNPYSANTLQESLAYNAKLKVLTKYGWQYIVPTGFALKCGANNKEFLLAIDCDGIEAYRQILAIEKGVSIDKIQGIQNAKALIELAEKFLPPTVSFSSGRTHRKQYLYKADLSMQYSLKSCKIHIKDDNYLEFRGTNLNSILPPSQHPTGKKYKWVTGSPSVVDVAPAPDWVIEQMVQTKKPTNIPKTQLCTPQEESSGEIETALNLLEAIHPKYTDDYHNWIRTGMALKSISNSLLPNWDRWSQMSAKYQKGMCTYKWSTFKNLRCGIRSLYYLAANS